MFKFLLFNRKRIYYLSVLLLFVAYCNVQVSGTVFQGFSNSIKDNIAWAMSAALSGSGSLSANANGDACENDYVLDMAFKNSLVACPVSMDATTNGQTVAACDCTIYDSGGAAGDYGASENYTLTLQAPAGQSVKLLLNSFISEIGYDYLTIYDGASTADLVLENFTGNLTTPETVISSGEYMTLKWFSDSGQQRAGFDAAISCVTTASIGNYVWRDANPDGLQQNDGTAGLGSLLIFLYKDNGSGIFEKVDSIWTDDIAPSTSYDPGYYIFNVEQSGTYKVKFPTPGDGIGGNWTLSDIGADDAIDSDVDILTGFSPAIVVDVNGTGLAKSNMTIDAGYIATCNVIADGTITVDNATNGTTISSLEGGVIWGSANASSGAYSDNEDYSVTIESPMTTGRVDVHPYFYNIPAGDQLIFYDGPNTSSPILATITGTSASPQTMTVVSTGRTMTVRIISDASTTGTFYMEFSTGDMLINTCWGWDVLLRSDMVEPDKAYVVSDNGTGSSNAPICVAYFDANKNLAKTEIGTCINFHLGVANPRSGRQYGQVSFDRDTIGTADIPPLTLARIAWVLKNAPLLGFDYNTSATDAATVQSTIRVLMEQQIGGGSLVTQAIAAVPTVPLQPLISIDGCTTVAAGNTITYTITTNSSTLNLAVSDGGALPTLCGTNPSGTSLSGNVLTVGGTGTRAVTVCLARSTATDLNLIASDTTSLNASNVQIYYPCDPGIQRFLAVTSETAAYGDACGKWTAAACTPIPDIALPCSGTSAPTSYDLPDATDGSAWSLLYTPSGTSVSIDPTTGLISNLSTAGDYVAILGGGACLDTVHVVQPACSLPCVCYQATQDGYADFSALGTTIISGAATGTFTAPIPGHGNMTVAYSITNGGRIRQEPNTFTSLDALAYTSLYTNDVPWPVQPIYLETSAGTTQTIDFTFDTPIADFDFIVYDVDQNDQVVITATDADGNIITDLSNWIVRGTGDATTAVASGQTAGTVGATPIYDVATGTLSSVADINHNRPFIAIRPDELIKSISISFTSTTTGNHVYFDIYGTISSASAPCCPVTCNTPTTLLVGDLLAAGGGEIHTFIFDPVNPSMCTTAPLPGGEGMAVDYTNEIIYIVDATNSKILKYDIVSGTYTELLSANPCWSYDMDLSPDGQFLYVTCTSQIYKVNTSTGAVVASISETAFSGTNNLWGVAVHPLTGEVYVTRGFNGSDPISNGSLSKIDANLTGPATTLTTVTDGSLLMGLEFSPNGTLWVVRDGKGVVSDAVLNYSSDGTSLLATYPMTPDLTAGSEPTDIAFGPDGNMYVATWLNYCVVKYDYGTSNWSELIPASAGSNGKTLAFACGLVNCATCSLTITSATPTACDPATNTYSLDVAVTYTNPPAGDMTINVGGTNYTFTPNGSGGETFTVTGLASNGTAGIDVSATFVGDAACTHTLADAYNAPASCGSDFPDPYPCTSATLLVGDLFPSGSGQTVAFPFGTGAIEPPMCSTILPFGGEGMQYCTTNNKVYISDADGSIVVWDVATNSQEATIPLGAGPFDAALSNDCSYLYVSMAAKVIAIDLSTNTIAYQRPIADFTGGTGQLWGVDVNPITGQVYVTRGFSTFSSGTIYSLNPDLQGTITTVVAEETGGFFMGMEFLPSGNFWVVWDADSGGGEEIRLYSSSGVLLDTIPMVIGGIAIDDTSPNDIAFGPDGNIYVSTYTTYCVIRYVPTTDTWEVYLPLDPSGALGKSLAFVCANMLCATCDLSLSNVQVGACNCTATEGYLDVSGLSNLLPDGITFGTSGTYSNVPLPGQGTVDITYAYTGTGNTLTPDFRELDVANGIALSSDYTNLGFTGTTVPGLRDKIATGETGTLTYNFDQPTSNINLIVFDVDWDDAVTVTAIDANGNVITDFSGWTFNTGDLTAPIDAAPAQWNAATAVISSTVNDNGERNFAMLTPDVALSQVVFSFTGTTDPNNNAPHTQYTIYSNLAGESCTATLTADVAWTNAPTGENIIVSAGAYTQTINVSGGVTSPQTISLLVPTDGSTNNPITAAFATTNTCSDSDSYNAPTCAIPVGSVGNYVWTDTNGNGLQDEPATNGINGVVVELWNATTNTIVSTTTTANDGSGNAGYYNFVVATSGDYYIKFPINSGNNVLTTQTTTASTDSNSDADLAGKSPTFTIDVNGAGTAKDNPTIDAGYTPTASCADLYVDDFARLNEYVNQDEDVSPYSYSNTLLNTRSLGGELDVISEGTRTAQSINRVLSVSSGRLSISNDAGVSTNTVTLVWDGADNNAAAINYTGLGGLDITNGGLRSGFSFDFNADFNSILSDPIIITLDVYTNSGAASRASITIEEPTNTITNYTIPFSSFASLLGSGATLSNIGAISLTIDMTSRDSFDAAIKNVKFFCAPPCTLTATADGTNVLCNGGTDGTATATASGNTAAVTYLWSNGGTTASISNLAAGTYTVTITEIASCTAVASYTVTEPALLSLTCNKTDVTTNGGTDGTATVSATGGTSPYTYLWNSGETTASISGKTSGTYTVTVTDANGCTDACSSSINEPGALCNLTGAGLAGATCNDNGTTADATDDYISFTLNPTGTTLGSGYVVTVSSGSITPSTGTYGAASNFQLQNGSAGSGVTITVTITDNLDSNCKVQVDVADTGTCSTPVCPPMKCLPVSIVKTNP
jgi:YVTN family beta-propeller protein